MLAAIEMSRSAERIVNSSANLSAVTTDEARQRVFDGLSHRSQKLKSLLQDLHDGGIAHERLMPIEERSVQVDANLTALDADVRLRLQLIARIKDLMRDAFDQRRDAAPPLPDPAGLRQPGNRRCYPVESAER